MSALGLLAESWTQAAAGYDAEVVPRFDPWTQDVIAQLRLHAAALPPGACVVPTCGPGQELPLVAAALGPERKVIGSDISPGMVELAKIRAAAAGPQCSAVVADAMLPLLPPKSDHSDDDSGGASNKLAAVLTVFGLQQLPDPVAAVASWCAQLEPGGVAVVCFWPPAGVEAEGPWATYANLVAARVGSSERKQATVTWDAQLPAAAEAAGAEVVLDAEPEHAMEWPDGDAIFEGMSRGGPWHATRLRRGDEFMEDIKREFLAVHPAGQIVRHTPHARLLVLRKKKKKDDDAAAGGAAAAATDSGTTGGLE